MTSVQKDWNKPKQAGHDGHKLYCIHFKSRAGSYEVGVAISQVWEGGGVVGLSSSNVNYTGKRRNSLPVFNGAQSQTSFSIINWAVLPSVKTNAYLALPRCAFLYFSPFVTSHKKDEKENTLQLLAEGKGGEKNQRKPWLSLFSPSVGRFFSPATSGCAVRWCIVFYSWAGGAAESPGPVCFLACSSLSLYLLLSGIRHCLDWVLCIITQAAVMALSLLKTTLIIIIREKMATFQDEKFHFRITFLHTQSRGLWHRYGTQVAGWVRYLQ